MRENRRRIRVLYLIDYLCHLGGAERFAAGLAANMPRDRIEPWVCSTRRADGENARLLADADIPHFNLDRRAKWDVHRLRGVPALLRREHFDILHSHMFGSNFWGSMFGRACGVPVVIAHEHNWSYQDDPLRLWLDGHVIGRLATRMIAVSESNRRLMVTREGVPAEKVVVLPTAYIPSQPLPGVPPTDLRAELGLGEHTPIVAVAAMLRKEKALEVMIEAHAKVVQRIPDAHLVIAGDGPCESELERQISERNMSARVHLIGLRFDVDSILQQVDVGAMSSDWEGMPLFAFECMANRTPLVATGVGGIPEIVEHGRTGMLVPPRDPTALADAIVKLLLDPDLRVRLANAAYVKLDQFTINAVALRFADLYEELVPR